MASLKFQTPLLGEKTKFTIVSCRFVGRGYSFNKLLNSLPVEAQFK